MECNLRKKFVGVSANGSRNFDCAVDCPKKTLPIRLVLIALTWAKSNGASVTLLWVL